MPGIALPIEGRLPFELGWDAVRWPILPIIEPRGDGYSARLGAGSFVATEHPAYLACATGPEFHCGPGGDDLAGTGTEELPFRTIWRAQQAANATGRSSRVVVQAGLYDGDQNFCGGSSGNQATVDTHYVARGGRVVVTTHRSSLRWIADPEVPGCWVTADLVAPPARVVALATLPDSLHSDLVPVPTVDALRATPMSYQYPSLLSADGVADAESGTLLMAADLRAAGWLAGDMIEVARADRRLPVAEISDDGHTVRLAAPTGLSGAVTLTILPRLRINRGGEPATENNTRVYRTLANFLQLGRAEHRSLFLTGAEAGSGFDLEGGATREGAGACLLVGFVMPGNGDAVVYAKDCTFRYGGSRGGGAGNGVQINNVTGLAMFESCDASANKSDGFNYHDSRNYGVAALLVNCTAAANGMDGSTANNGMTCHEGVRMVVLGGALSRSGGPSCHAVHESRAFVMGLVSADSRGDAMFGGCGRPCEIRTSDDAVIYAWHVRARPSAINGLAFAATEASLIHKRDCPPATVADFGHVDDFPANTAAWGPQPVDHRTAETAVAAASQEPRLTIGTRSQRSCATSASAASPPAGPAGSPSPLAQ